jgi:hypothetical protein
VYPVIQRALGENTRPDESLQQKQFTKPGAVSQPHWHHKVFVGNLSPFKRRAKKFLSELKRLAVLVVNFFD